MDLAPTRRHAINLCCCLALLVSPWSYGWCATDKTELDLERGRPEATSRYKRPRGAQRYQYDKTEVDLATPLKRSPRDVPQPAAPSDMPAPSERPATPDGGR